jgi:hypothetical protein
MNKLFLTNILLLFFSPSVFAEGITNDQIVQNIIQNSIATYSGNCPCPYNISANGSKCGRRSAYSKPGGYAPLCYPADVTPAMISSYKHKHGIRQ